MRLTTFFLFSKLKGVQESLIASVLDKRTPTAFLNTQFRRHFWVVEVREEQENLFHYFILNPTKGPIVFLFLHPLPILQIKEVLQFSSIDHLTSGNYQWQIEFDEINSMHQ